VDRVLEAAVHLATGLATAEPRPGQRALAHDVLDAMTRRDRVVAQAPTGVGKSFSHLVPAAVMAVATGERTVISTESLALQSQIIDKDAPTVGVATAAVLGSAPRVAVLKGWGNYACFGPDVEVLTYDGVRKIGSLAGQKVKLLDGDGKWVESEIKDFGVQDIVELTVSRQRESKIIETTSDHRWFTQKDADHPPVETVTSELRQGDRLAYNGPRNKSLGKMIPSTFGIATGLVFGDGSRFRSTDGGVLPGACCIQLHGAKKMPLARFFNGSPQTDPYRPRPEYAEDAVLISGLPSFFKDYPDLDTNSAYLYGWLVGYFAADGSVTAGGSPSISSARREHLQFVTKVCARLGIDHGTIRRQDRVGKTANGATSPLYKLHLAPRSLEEKFFLIEEHRKRFAAIKTSYRPQQAARRWVVVSATATNRRKRVYCAIVPTTQSFTLSGNILTGNCSLRATHSARTLLGEPDDDTPPPDPAAALTDLARRLPSPPPEGAKKKRPAARAKATDADTVDIDGAVIPRAEAIPLLHWALTEGAEDGSGDKNSYTGTVSEASWSTVSVSTTECVGAAQCPFGDVCRPDAARTTAAAADIVVTNHSMLGVQAANAAPVVIGSQRLGLFRHLIVDEAHRLPGVVREQGAAAVSGRRVTRIQRGLSALLDSNDPLVKALLTDGDVIKDVVDQSLAEQAATTPKKESVLRCSEGMDPLASTGDLLTGWLGRVNTMVGTVPVFDQKTQIKKMRVTGAVTSLKADLTAVREHRNGVARWVEKGSEPSSRFARGTPAAAKSTPVEVGGSLAFNVYSAEVPGALVGHPAVPETDWLSTTAQSAAAEALPEHPPRTEEDGEEITSSAGGALGAPRYALSVSAMYATLPNGFGRDAGLHRPTRSYESPFDTAYGRSVLFVPRASAPEDVEALNGGWPGGKVRLDTTRHTAWAASMIAALVQANNGSALILAATAAAGRSYAAQLRAAGTGPHIHSQWDGGALRQITAAWREDVGSVLVGTRSLMTGVDAPGETCSLVVIDRVPRAAGNPVDDARVEALTPVVGDRWLADSLVYAADAALLLEQAAGRLIRSVGDSGMVAVLDPRLLKTGSFSYAARSRDTYMSALHRFARKTADLDVALEFLRTGRQGFAA